MHVPELLGVQDRVAPMDAPVQTAVGIAMPRHSLVTADLADPRRALQTTHLGDVCLAVAMFARRVLVSLSLYHAW